jgi:hypothetical protein
MIRDKIINELELVSSTVGYSCPIVTDSANEPSNAFAIKALHSLLPWQHTPVVFDFLCLPSDFVVEYYESGCGCAD